MSEMQRLRELFDAMLDLPMEQWEDWFEARAVDTATRSELRRLAAADDATSGPLDQSLVEFAALEDAARADPIGRCYGPFRLLRRLGEGGMASVFLAAREGADFEQTVALKLLKRGTLSQIEQGFFRRERQVLARLSHPNIARLIDGGVSADGIPYLAMEYVEGISITHWCRERELDVQARVALLAKVARAAAAAHAALVVHRDIKPSNVLVTAAGDPVLLDFGIAKLLQDEEGERTRSGFAPMTPEYAAPEQLQGGAITTATDVYALGLLLYELLTGERADRRRLRSPSTLLAARRRERGPALHALRVGRDLDRIALMALAEEPVRRYAGAADMADDLDRFLSRRPVRAHPPSAWYRTRKFVERHRGGVALTLLLLIGILTSLALALWQARIAREEATRAGAVRDFVVDLLRRTTPERPEAERPDIPTLVYTAAAALPKTLQDQPAVRTELLFTLGNVLRQMRDVARSEALLREALASAQALPEDSPLRISAQVELSRTLLRRGEMADAAQTLAPVLALPERRLPEAVPRAMLLKLAMAIEASRGSMTRARELGDEALRAYRRDCARGLRCAEVAFVENDLGMVRIGLGEPRAARELLRAALQRKRADDAGSIALAETLTALAYAGYLIGDLAQAERDVREAITLLRELGNGVSQPPLAQLRQLGLVLLAQARADEAVVPLQEALQALQARATGSASGCGRSEYRTPFARALLEAGRVGDARVEAQTARSEAADCATGDRLMNRLLADLAYVRALAATQDPDAAAAYAELQPERTRAGQASPMRRLMVYVESLRAARALGDAEATRRDARALQELLRGVEAETGSPALREAEAALAPD
jgi:serine/threonine protein kinase